MLRDAIDSLLADARASRQRRLLILSGEQQWGKALFEQYSGQRSFEKKLWVADYHSPVCDAIDHSKAKQYLGRELDLIVYDAYCGFNPNAVAALSGALCAGGLLVFIVPSLEQWGNCVDPDYRRLLVHPFELHQISQRFIELIKQSLLQAPARLLIEQHQAAPHVNSHSLKTAPYPSEQYPNELYLNKQYPNKQYQESNSGTDRVCRTQDQSRAVEAIIKVATGHRRRPLVITSDRGRGKTSALGIAAASLMTDSPKSIVITAPNRAAVQAVFDHAAAVLGVVASNKNTLQYQHSSIHFMAPDELLKQTTTADLVLIDEAAAIPAAMLEGMLKRYSRVVFSTTEHGYEGTGRGFAIRFKQSLDAITPQWKSLQLVEPIRWAKDDPVERWLFDALLLDCHRERETDLPIIDAHQCVIEPLDRDNLLVDRESLKQLFGLLVNAHYQTTPNDLRNLLDGPNISIWVTRFKGQIVAAALLAEEGRFEPPLAEAIWKGQRRPLGHLLPQTLAVHSGWQDAPGRSYWRVMRIAVDSDAQRQGLGKQLLQAIVHQARLSGIDMLGASFAATADVLAFWRNAQCVPVRVGVTKDACTGVPSALVLCALSVPAQQWLARARTRFVEQFCYGLSSIYRDLTFAVVAQLLLDDQIIQSHWGALDQQDCLVIRAFANGQHQFDVCLLPLFKLVCLALSCSSLSATIEDKNKELLVRVVLQHQDIKAVADALKLTGKKQLLLQLRKVIGHLTESVTRMTA
jgi:tRNA(Met) cytidine acetyltransferase